MELDGFIFFGIVIVGIAIIAFLVTYFGSKQKMIRKLKEIPRSSINNIKVNQLTKVTGKAVPINEPLIAPYSQRACVFYKIKIERKRKSGKNSYWDTMVNEEEIQSFFLEKNSELLIVNPSKHLKNYKSHLVVDKTTSSGTFNEPTAQFKALLDHYDIKHTDFIGFNKQIRYSEAIVEIGEEITVAGIAKWKTLNEPIAGYSYSKIATLESTPEQPLLITDLPKERFTER